MSDGAEAVNGQDHTDPEDADRTQQETEASGTPHRSRVRNYVLPAAIIGVAVLILLTMYRCEGILKPSSEVPPLVIATPSTAPIGPYKPREGVCRLLDMTALEAAIPLTDDLEESYVGPDSVDPAQAGVVKFTTCTRTLDTSNHKTNIGVSAWLYGSSQWAEKASRANPESSLTPGATPEPGVTAAPDPWRIGETHALNCHRGGHGLVALNFWHENLLVTINVRLEDPEACDAVKDPESVRKAFVGLADQFRALLSP